ncbi:MAG: hypothetical protein WKG03_22710 [Telluria sp.]
MNLPPVDANALHHGVDAFDGSVGAGATEVGISGCGEDALVAKNLLNVAQTDTRFD